MWNPVYFWYPFRGAWSPYRRGDVGSDEVNALPAAAQSALRLMGGMGEGLTSRLREPVADLGESAIFHRLLRLRALDPETSALAALSRRVRRLLRYEALSTAVETAGRNRAANGHALAAFQADWAAASAKLRDAERASCGVWGCGAQVEIERRKRALAERGMARAIQGMIDDDALLRSARADLQAFDLHAGDLANGLNGSRTDLSTRQAREIRRLERLAGFYETDGDAACPRRLTYHHATRTPRSHPLFSDPVMPDTLDFEEVQLSVCPNVSGLLDRVEIRREDTLVATSEIRREPDGTISQVRIRDAQGSVLENHVWSRPAASIVRYTLSFRLADAPEVIWTEIVK
ncbi:hypothetical protein [Methylobacterium crusticola]|uniref:hypothetical protein n=1 Tax=Methylobacterium crusticola TaxID=1697972 RepID=UPI000FFB5E82|nr:hypothetical protein [Methylobacterium crusticola]